MATVLGVDAQGLVRMVLSGAGAREAAMPVVLNGETITARVLTPAQEAAWGALPTDRAGTRFDGGEITPIALDAPRQQPVDRFAALTKLLIEKNLISADELAAALGQK